MIFTIYSDQVYYLIVSPPSPREVHVLISRSYEYVTLLGKADFADVIKLRILKWGNCPTLSRRAPCKGRREARGSESEEGVKIEAVEGEGLEPRKAPLGSGKGKETNHTRHKNQFEMDHGPKCKM